MPDLRVRCAVVEDGDEIGEVHGAAWEAAYSHLFSASFLAAMANGPRAGWRPSISRILAPPRILLVGEADGTVRAFAHAVPPGDSSRSAEILGFYAHPDVWGTGLAGLLMQQTCDALAGSGSHEVVLWTPRDAGRARRFYEKVGFMLTGDARTDRLTDWEGTSDADCPQVEYDRRLVKATNA